MSDYKEQANSLREHADLIETSIELYGPSATRLLVYDLRNAADAIEALQAAEPTEKQVVDYCHKRCLVVLAADLFHELKASYGKMPKRGEWKTTDAFPHRVYCSNCFKTYVPNDRWQIWVDKPGEGGLERNYCPSCGAKMEAHDAN